MAPPGFKVGNRRVGHRHHGVADLAALADALEGEGQELLLQLAAGAGERGLDLLQEVDLGDHTVRLGRIEQQAQEAGGELLGALRRDLADEVEKVGPRQILLAEDPPRCGRILGFDRKLRGEQEQALAHRAPMMVSVRPSVRLSSTLARFRPAVLAANWSTIWLNESASSAISSRPGMLTRTSSSPSRTRVAASARVVTGMIQRRERNR